MTANVCGAAVAASREPKIHLAVRSRVSWPDVMRSLVVPIMYSMPWLTTTGLMRVMLFLARVSFGSRRINKAKQ